MLILQVDQIGPISVQIVMFWLCCERVLIEILKKPVSY